MEFGDRETRLEEILISLVDNQGLNLFLVTIDSTNNTHTQRERGNDKQELSAYRVPFERAIL